jgi:hypothetical protein
MFFVVQFPRSISQKRTELGNLLPKPRKKRKIASKTPVQQLETFEKPRPPACIFT